MIIHCITINSTLWLLLIEHDLYTVHVTINRTWLLLLIEYDIYTLLIQHDCYY